MSDGASVYECTSNDEVIDLLQGGQGVFGIAIGGVWREIEGTLAELPSERTGRGRRPASTPATSSPPAGAPAPPAERRTPRLDRRGPLTTCPIAGAASRRGAGRLGAADNPARESLRAACTAVRASAEGATPPRNLSGARTVRTRQLWSTRSTARDRGGGARPTASGASSLRRDQHRQPSLRRPRAACRSSARHIGPAPADVAHMLEVARASTRLDGADGRRRAGRHPHPRAARPARAAVARTRPPQRAARPGRRATARPRCR